MVADAWFGLVSGLLGVAVGALAESLRARSQFRREKWWVLFEQRRERLEELYTVVDEHRRALQHAYWRARAALQNGKQIDLEKQPSIPWARLRLLVALHAPELSEQFAALQSASNQFGQVLSQVILSTPSSPADRKSLSEELSSAFDGLENVYEQFLSKIVAIANALWKGAAGTAGLNNEDLH